MVNLIQRVTKFIRGGYDATDISGKRRRPAPTVTTSEDYLLNERKRTILSANARDLTRNLSLAHWAVQTHLSYITDLTFSAQTEDREWNAYLESWWAEQSKPWNFDIAGRHDFLRGTRIAEACRLLDGDVGWLLYDSGPYRGKVQFIEGDRIDMPKGAVPKNQNAEDWINGVRIDPKTGRTMAYGLCKRHGTRKELERTVPASRLLLHAHYGFRYDQIRGSSVLSSALNTYRDYYETIEFAKAKVKLSQVLGLAIQTDAANGEFFTPGQISGEADSDDEGSSDDGSMTASLEGHAPFVANLSPGESLNVIESKSPSAETMALVEHMARSVLSALSIPYSMWNEGSANYAGQRAALFRYLYCAATPIRELQTHLTRFARWKMGLAIEDGTLVLPEGKDFNWIRFEFVPGGVPFDQPQREAKGVGMMVQMGLNNPYDAAKEVGKDFETNIDKTAAAFDYAKSKNVPLNFGDGVAFSPDIVVQTEQPNE